MERDQLTLFTTRAVTPSEQDRQDDARIAALEQERARLLTELMAVERELAERYYHRRRRAGRREQWLHSLYGTR